MREKDNFDSSNPDAHDRVATPFLSRAQVGCHCHALQEWRVERPHAIMKKATKGKKAYATAASLEIRLREIRDIACHPEGRSMLEKAFRFQASASAIAIEIECY